MLRLLALSSCACLLAAAIAPGQSIEDDLDRPDESSAIEIDAELADWIDIETEQFLGDRPLLNAMLDEPFRYTYGLVVGPTRQLFRNDPFVDDPAPVDLFGIDFETAKRRFDGNEPLLRFQFNFGLEFYYDGELRGLDRASIDLYETVVQLGYRRHIARLGKRRLNNLVFDFEFGLDGRLRNEDVELEKHQGPLLVDLTHDGTFFGVGPYAGIKYRRNLIGKIDFHLNALGALDIGNYESDYNGDVNDVEAGERSLSIWQRSDILGMLSGYVDLRIDCYGIDVGYRLAGHAFSDPFGHDTSDGVSSGSSIQHLFYIGVAFSANLRDVSNLF